MPGRLIETTTRYAGRRVSVEERTYEAPDGREYRREVGRHPGAVCVLPLLEDGNIVLIRNVREAVGETLIELVAGTLEPGEDPAACAARELEEEAGYRASGIKPLLTFWTTPGLWDEQMHAFVATGLSPIPPRPEAGEEIEPFVVPYADALGMALDGTIRDAKTLTMLLLHARVTRR